MTIQYRPCGLAATTLCSIAIAVGSLSASAQSFKAIDLGSLKDAVYSRATAINNLGIVVGVSGKNDSSGNDVPRATVWSGKTPIDLNAILKSDRSMALGISDLGDVTGGGATANGLYRPFTWMLGDKTPTWLAAPDNADTFAVASGLASAIGYSRLKDGSFRPQIWKKGLLSSAINRSELPLPFGSTGGAANAMNKLGVIAGFADKGSVRHAIAWILNNPVDLGTLPGGKNSFTSSISELGVISGVADDKYGIPHAFTWDLKGGMKDLGTFAKNASDQAMAAVGSTGRISGLLGSTAFAAKDNKLFDFSTVMPSDGLQWKSLGGGNLFGYVPGSAIGPDGALHAYLAAPKIGLKTFTLDKSTVDQGGDLTGTLSLDALTPITGMIVKVGSDSTSAIAALGSYTLDKLDMAFKIPFKVVGNVTKDTKVKVWVSYEDQTLTAMVIVHPAPLPALKELSLSTLTVPGGSTLLGKLKLSDVAPPSGLQIPLTSDNPSLTVPKFVTVAAGKSETTFDCVSKAVDKDVIANVSATLNNISVKKSVTVLKSLKSVVVSTLTLVKSQVASGEATVGKIVLSDFAPAAGLIVLISADGNSVNMSSSLTILAGQKEIAFDIKTLSVAKDTAVTITAATLLSVKTAKLLVLPKK